MSYSELARFFDDFHMPLLPPEVDERLLLESLGLCQALEGLPTDGEFRLLRPVVESEL